MDVASARHPAVALGLVVFVWVGGARAANGPSVDVRVDRKQVSVGESLRLTVRASSRGRRPIRVEKRMQPGEAFRTIGRGRSPRLTIRNGRTFRSLRLSYRLTATRTGQHEIQPPTLSVGGRRVQPDPVSVTVRPKGRGGTHGGDSRSGRGDRRGGRSGDDRRDGSSKAVFVRAKTPDDRQRYVGEQFPISYHLLHDPRKLDIEPRPPKVPSFDDFWVEDLSKSRAGNSRMKVIDGRPYESTTLRAYILFPLQAGRLTIEPLEVTVRSGGFFAPTRSRDVTSDPIEIDVQPLPEPSPAGFQSGNVGQWRFSSELRGEELAVGQGATLKLSARGTGNIRQLTLPSPPDLEGLAVQNRQTDSESWVRHGRAGGEKTVRYTIVPTEPGKLRIPQIAFSYFDPVAETYQTRHAGPFTLHVQPSRGRSRRSDRSAAADAGPASPRKPEPPSERSALLSSMSGPLPIAENPPTDARTSSRIWTLWWLGALLPLLGSGLVLVLPTIRRRLNAPESSTPLDGAERAIERAENGPLEEAPGHVVDACEAVASTLDEGPSGSNAAPRPLEDALTESGISEDRAQGAARALEWAREVEFAPEVDPDREDLDEAIASLRRVVEALRDGGTAASTASAASATGLAVATTTALIAAVGSPGPAAAAGPDTADTDGTPAEAARRAHLDGDWKRAVEGWRTIVEQTGSPAARHNLGVALAHREKYGRARVALERAVLASPSNARIRASLQALRRLVAIERYEKDGRQSGRATPADAGPSYQPGLLRRLDTRVPAAGGVLGLWLLFAGLVGVRFGRQSRLERFARGGVAVGIAMALSAGALAIGMAATTAPADRAVLLKGGVEVKRGPSTHAATVTEGPPLVAGMTGRLLDRRSDWLRVGFGRRRGWIAREEVAVIHSASPDEPADASKSTEPSPTAESP
ncbi:MAG: BatD family protein [Bradymonadaceae bacterium]